jgi:hypothetical protein
MAEAIVYSNSLLHDADLLACGVDLKDLPRVMFFPKTGP